MIKDTLEKLTNCQFFRMEELDFPQKRPKRKCLPADNTTLTKIYLEQA